jgi:toxin YoeB
VRKIWDEKAWEDYLYWQFHDKQMLKRVNMLIRDVERSPFDGIGKPEPLRGDLSGFWSRRINDEHRLVYRVQNGMLEIASCRDHYS